MSSTGNCCSNCGCFPQQCTCILRTVPSNFEGVVGLTNVNLVGVGVADSQDGNDLNFRGVASASSALIVTYDANNHAIMLTLDIPSIVNDLPDATTTQRGVLETATDAEAIAKVATDKILTPSNLAALGSSTTFAGLVELATNAETQAGLSTTLAVTPAGLASLVSTLGTTTTWADSAARAVLVPDFEGQFGYQLDQDMAFVANGTLAGQWSGLLTLGSTGNTLVATTTMTPAGFTFTVFGNGSFVIDQTTFQCTGNTNTFDNGVVRFGTGAATVFDWASFTVLTIAGATVPANSVLTTTAAGVPTSALKAAFISTFNTQTGYTAFANGAVLRTCDTTTVTLPQLAQIVGTLIEDLKAVQLPAV
jgi:hypothetical protein